MKTLATRSDFDFNFSWFRVLGFRVLGFSVSGFRAGLHGFTVFVILESKQLKPCAGI